MHHDEGDTLRGRGTILVVDDNSGFLEVLCDLLRREDYDVIPASDPAEALYELNRHPIDLAVIDIRLLEPNNPNDRSGLNLSTSVGLKVPVIFITAHPGESQEPQRAGTYARVSKNSDSWRSELLDHIQAIIQPVVYISHPGSPRAAEVASYVKTLDLICSGWHPDRTDDGLHRSFRTEAKRVAFVIVLVTTDDTLPAYASSSSARSRERVSFEWGYFSSKLPKRTIVLHEDGAYLSPHADPGSCVRFDRGGSWMTALREKLRAEGLYRPQ